MAVQCVSGEGEGVSDIGDQIERGIDETELAKHPKPIPPSGVSEERLIAALESIESRLIEMCDYLKSIDDTLIRSS